MDDFTYLLCDAALVIPSLVILWGVAAIVLVVLVKLWRML